jgi:hypothetical protein
MICTDLTNITLIFLLITNTLLLFLIPSSTLAASNENVNNQSSLDTHRSMSNLSDKISLDVASQYEEYTSEFQNAKIYVIVGTEERGVIRLELEQKNSAGEVVHETSQLLNNTTRHHEYTFLFHPGEVGTYDITVRAIQNGNVQEALTTFSVISIWQTTTVMFLYLALAFFGALLILIGISKQDTGKEEILRFLFLSGIVGSMLASLLFTQFPVAETSPVGLVKIQSNQSAVDNNTKTIWVFSVGGEFYIPIYVIVFGLTGGYLRYLYKTSRLLTDGELRKEREDVINYLATRNVNDAERRLIFFESLKDVSLFLLAPILATVVWFLFSQWEPINDSPELLAVFSFASGLVTTEIVKRISEFTKDNLNKRSNSSG